jgi:hypothetical protein
MDRCILSLPGGAGSPLITGGAIPPKAEVRRLFNPISVQPGMSFGVGGGGLGREGENGGVGAKVGAFLR